MTEDFLPVGTEILVPVGKSTILRGVIVEVDSHDLLLPYRVMPLDKDCESIWDTYWIPDEEIVIIR